MAELHQLESIYRTLLLPRDHSNSGAEGTIRLRHTLAKDGCKESQVSLAKSLLTAVSDSPEERAFNAQCAVYWLLQAVKTGQEEAFKLLEHCAKLGLGINAVNSAEVEKCLKYSEEEKTARKVAFLIFHTTMIDPELIPSDLFGDKVDLIFQSKTPAKSNDESLIDEAHTKVEETLLQDYKPVSFSEVVNSVQSCLEGSVPLVSLKQVIHYPECKSWFSKRYLLAVWDVILLSTEKLIANFSSLQISLSVLLMIIFLKFVCIFVLHSSETLLMISKYESCLVSSFIFINMLSCSCFLINLNFGGDNLKRWLHLIKYFEPNLKSIDIERKHLAKSFNPLLLFFLASFIYTAFVPESYNIVSSDIGILCFILMVLVDRTISQQRYFVNISLILNILTCLYKANIIQSTLSNYGSYFNFNIDYELGKNLYLHFSILSCLALPFVLPYLYLKMALGKQSKYWLLVLLPHLMSLKWLNLACNHYQNISINLFFNILSWFVLLLLSYYTGFLFTFMLFIIKNIFKKDDYFRMEFFVLIPVYLLFYWFSAAVVKKYKISYESKLWSSIVCFAILVLSFQSARSPNAAMDSKSDLIPWEKYQQYCHHNAWYRSNTADVQISCLPLKGRDVSFEGTVTSIDMIQVKNNFQFITNLLPDPLKSWFVCLFGENYSSCLSNNLLPSEKERCKMYDVLNLPECHLRNWDVYKYRITVEIFSRTSPEVYLIIDHLCSSFIKTLKDGDTIKVVGRLDSNIGGSSPIFTLKKATCVSCYTNVDCNINFSQLKLPQFEFSLKNVVWYYFAPFIKYDEK